MTRLLMKSCSNVQVFQILQYYMKRLKHSDGEHAPPPPFPTQAGPYSYCYVLILAFYLSIYWGTCYDLKYYYK